MDDSIINQTLDLFSEIVRVKDGKYKSIDLIRQKMKDELDRMYSEITDVNKRSLILLALCVLVDETVMLKFPALVNEWGRNSMQNHYLSCTNGGEQFFINIDSLIKNKTFDSAVLSVYYLCLLFGVKGRYLNSNVEFIDNYKNKLFDKLNSYYRGLLSSHKEVTPEKIKRKKVLWYKTKVGAMIIALVVFVVAHYLFEVTLSQRANAVIAMLDQSTQLNSNKIKNAEMTL